uniref:Uncharacterized protein n=1 Tax=Oryza glaberrima TaxID=4538 RepID=I1NW65_ORYGL
MVEPWEDKRNRGQYSGVLVYCYDAGRGLVHAQTRAAGEGEASPPSSAKNKATSMMAFAVSRALETSNRNNYQGGKAGWARGGSKCMHADAGAAPRHRRGPRVRQLVQVLAQLVAARTRRTQQRPAPRRPSDGESQQPSSGPRCLCILLRATPSTVQVNTRACKCTHGVGIL